jgi:holliday junction DNA helicase RuvA
MIAFIRGDIFSLTPTYVIVDTGTVAYHVNISVNTFSQIRGKKECLLYTYLHITGGTQSPMNVSVYGFAEEAEREMFIYLLSISGVGASTVRLILSELKPIEVQAAILEEDVRRFERIKGIGPKTAKRVILELKDKISKTSVISSNIAPIGGNNIEQEALSALVMLGFNRNNAQQALRKLEKIKDGELTVEGLIKAALKHL